MNLLPINQAMKGEALQILALVWLFFETLKNCFNKQIRRGYWVPENLLLGSSALLK